MNIEFSISADLWGIAAKPQRAIKQMPTWWSRLAKDSEDEGFPSHTVKACTPVFDAMSAGYVIPLPFDLHVKASGGDVRFNWRFAPGTYVDAHPIEQAPIYGGAWKLMNPWVIKTPPGTSVLITDPLHRPELPFHSLEAVVDTDTYHNQINFPFLWNEPDYDDVLRAGTPFVQVIPFRREAWSMTVCSMNEKMASNTNRHQGTVNANQHAYRRMYHSPKKFREARQVEDV